MDDEQSTDYIPVISQQQLVLEMDGYELELEPVSHRKGLDMARATTKQQNIPTALTVLAALPIASICTWNSASAATLEAAVKSARQHKALT